MLRFGLIILSVLLASGCKRIDRLTQFNLEYNEEVTIPSSTGVNLPFNFLTPEVPTNSEASFEVNDTRKDLIEQIILKSLIITVISPPSEDFSFLKSINIFIAAEGLAETKIAWKEQIPDNAGNRLQLETTGADMQEYIKKENFSLRVNVVTDEILTAEYKINVNSVFFVDARILGQ